MPELSSLRKKLFLALAATVASCLLCGAQESLTPDARAGKLMADVEFLSGGPCSGRATGTAGYGEAASYVLRRFRGIGGLVPAGGFWTESFPVADTLAGHNVVALLPATVPNPAGCIVVMAALDGMGTLGGSLYPGADFNASGVAAMLAVAERLAALPARSRSVLFLALDGSRKNYAGAERFLSLVSAGLVPDTVEGRPLRMSRISLAVNLNIIGSALSPVVKYRKEYLLALGGSAYSRSMEKCNAGKDLHLSYDYYGSRDFTDLFYRRTGDHKAFLEKGIRCVLFTSGITMLTNKVADTPGTLDYSLMEKRTAFISDWLETFIL